MRVFNNRIERVTPHGNLGEGDRNEGLIGATDKHSRLSQTFLKYLFLRLLFLKTLKSK